MDVKGTEKSEIKPLTQVPSGKECQLVGIESLPGRRHPFRHHRRKRGFGRRHGREEPCPHKSITDQEDRQIMQRLLDLGLTKGCSFEVVHGGTSGPVLVEVRGTRIALGQKLARRLLVKSCR
ncbi:MAG: hypothetical protein BAJATHORv1_40167 [Candidatus Thorarchaeota archaeon]|nr:MAG: hypothetical protein BAJATHORv1_40167 [Candidatus Thorarchaeota archaeon]